MVKNKEEAVINIIYNVMLLLLFTGLLIVTILCIRKVVNTEISEQNKIERHE